MIYIPLQSSGSEDRTRSQRNCIDEEPEQESLELLAAIVELVNR